LGSILPSKKDSRPVSFAAAVPLPTTTPLLRQSSTVTTASIASGSTGGGGISAVSVGGGENNRAFDSLSSDTLRQVIGTTSNIANNNIVGNGDDFEAGVDPGSNVGGSGIMMKKKGSSSSTKQPLGGSSMMNQQQLLPSNNNDGIPSGVVKPSSSTATVISSLTSATTSSCSSSSEPITIIEHRKRPCGNGHTVHTYLRGKLLGKGGFAKVYKVTSLDTNKEYAVKVVPKANLVKSRARQKVSNLYRSILPSFSCCCNTVWRYCIVYSSILPFFSFVSLWNYTYQQQQLQTEIKIHRAMKHANICEYKHFFEDKTNCYILLELCHNQSMNEMIKRRKCLTEEETRLLMLQMVDAVTFMHDSNVIHRDLKLGNLFLSKTMNIKVGDFGLACRVDSSDEKRRTICGTPNYIAPEVIEGNKEKRGHSFEVDVWSMGVVCYTMLVGKPPYESTDVKSTYKRILSNEYSFPQGKVSCDARLLIAAMLQTDPKMR
jgi:polo-like kinase 1